ncbi:MAG: bifunctional hydroxymethylpyrimidine kinase/phosphomethylpyrimidine kinase [Sphingomonadales bacterium]
MGSDPKPRGRVLAIAGSDPSGGAGIEADIKTITALGGFAATAITAITLQDTHGVHDIRYMDPVFVGRQIEAVMADIGADCIKIGMLGSADMVRAVAGALKEAAAGIPVVLDPVLASTRGQDFLGAEALEDLTTLLLPAASLLTPNIHEAQALTGLEIGSAEDMQPAALALIEMGAGAVLLKGSHLPGPTITDLLIWADGSRVFEAPRIDSKNTHGTGCTLASAVATGLAFGLPLESAASTARDFVRRAIELAPGLGGGDGPLGHAAAGGKAGAKKGSENV